MSFIKCLESPMRNTVGLWKRRYCISFSKELLIANWKENASAVFTTRHLSSVVASPFCYWNSCPARRWEGSLVFHRSVLYSCWEQRLEVFSRLPFSTGVDKSQPSNSALQNGPTKSDSKTEEPQKLSVFQKFKQAYKQHGKILIGVHAATSIVWFSIFYVTASSGLDVVPILEKVGLPDVVIRPFRSGSLGTIAVAYLLYKLFTPLRYTVTLAGTNYVIKYMRRTGKMAPIKEGERLRELYKEGRAKLRDSKLRKARVERLRMMRLKKKAEK